MGFSSGINSRSPSLNLLLRKFVSRKHESFWEKVWWWLIKPTLKQLENTSTPQGKKKLSKSSNKSRYYTPCVPTRKILWQLLSLVQECLNGHDNSRFSSSRGNITIVFLFFSFFKLIGLLNSRQNRYIQATRIQNLDIFRWEILWFEGQTM